MAHHRALDAATPGSVAGCATTDDDFLVMVMALDGTSSDYGPRWTNGLDAAADQGLSRDEADMDGIDGWRVRRTLRIEHRAEEDRDGGVFGWRRVVAAADLPAGTTFVALVRSAFENAFIDTAFPEFHGHYADDAEVVRQPREP